MVTKNKRGGVKVRGTGLLKAGRKAGKAAKATGKAIANPRNSFAQGAAAAAATGKAVKEAIFLVNARKLEKAVQKILMYSLLAGKSRTNKKLFSNRLQKIANEYGLKDKLEKIAINHKNLIKEKEQLTKRVLIKSRNLNSNSMNNRILLKLMSEENANGNGNGNGNAKANGNGNGNGNAKAKGKGNANANASKGKGDANGNGNAKKKMAKKNQKK